MPAALQCPDCGHQEMLDNVGSAATFRCGGCGRALKVPAQFRPPPEGRKTGPGARADSPLERTQSLPRVPAAPPATTPPAVSPPVMTPPMTAPLGAGGVMPTTLSPVAVPPTGAAPAAVTPRARPPAGPPPGAAAAPAGATQAPMAPPLILRLAVWLIALPLGSLIVFVLASGLGFLTRRQLEDTILLPGWGRFVPIARLLPFCALATALLVQLGVFGLERLRDRNLRRGPPGRRRPGGGRGSGGPRRPMAPAGQRRGATNGSRSRDRVIS